MSKASCRTKDAAISYLVYLSQLSPRAPISRAPFYPFCAFSDVLRVSPQNISYFVPEAICQLPRLFGGHVDLRMGQSSLQRELCLYTLDAMRRIDVLDQGYLVAGRRPLPRRDGRIC